MNPLKNVQKNVQPALGLVGGGIGANLFATKLTFIQNDKMRAGAPILLGLLLMGSKNKMLANAGMGMIAVGGAKLVGTFVPALSGVTESDINGLYDRTYNQLKVYSEPMNGEPPALGAAEPSPLGMTDYESITGGDDEPIQDAELISDYAY